MNETTASVPASTPITSRPRVRFLAGDIWDAPDDGKTYEVIDGRFYMAPPPS